MAKSILLITLGAALLSGCANVSNRRARRQLTLRYQAAPATAELYLDGARYAPTGQKLATIHLSEAELERGIYTLTVPEARWPSGAVAPQTTQTIPLDSMSHTLTIRHPAPNSAAERYDAMKSHRVSVRYLSEPSRALVFNNGKNLGRAPASTTLTFSAPDLERGYLLAPDMSARWTSGAQTNSGAIKVPLDGSIHTHTFIRPEHPDLEVDLHVVRSEAERDRLEREETQRQALLKKHYAKLEEIEADKLKLEQEKLELLKKQQRAEEKHDAELIRLRKYEIDKMLRLKEQQLKQEQARLRAEEANSAPAPGP